MNICVIGSGYVGLVSGTCFSEMGNKVVCVDVDEKKINNLKNGIIPIYEPGLQEMIMKNMSAGRLKFTTSLKEALQLAEISFIAVGTPSSEDGSADLTYVLGVAKQIGKLIERDHVLVNKSTVPVGTGYKIMDIISEELALRKLKIQVDVVSNPEFLKEGAAIEDFMKPDRIIVGAESSKSIELMRQLYEPFIINGHPIHIMDIKSSELTKYAANAMLATRISFMNDISRLCDLIGADISKVRVGIGSDRRIGNSFLYPGIGYGGSCFPKDVRALLQIAKENNMSLDLVRAVESVNEKQKKYIVEKIVNRFGDDLQNKIFGIWGLAFKPQTDDMREAPSIVIIKELIERGAQIVAYDPEAIEQTKMMLSKSKYTNILYAQDKMDAVKDVDALILATEWRQFRQPNFQEMLKLMKQSIIFDGRNQYEPSKMKELGFEYYCIGRNKN